MKTPILKAALILCMSVLCAACGENASEKKAGEMLRQAQTLFDKGNYDKAVATIDSLRKACPEAADARKAALRMYQEIELKRAQTGVETADKAIAAAERKYEEMRRTVEELRAKGELTAGHLSSLTRMKLRLDSLRTVFDVECAKIKYIRKKMAE